MRVQPTKYERQRFRFLLNAAFREVHAFTLHAASTAQFVSQFYAYPELSRHSNGLPSLRPMGPFANGPKQYSSLLFAAGLIGALGGAQLPAEDFPVFGALVDWCDAQPTFRGYLAALTPENGCRFVLAQLVAGAVDRSLLQFGLVPPSEQQAAQIVEPLLTGVCAEVLDLTLVVPIAMTHFGFKRYSVFPAGGVYICEMGDRTNLARFHAEYLGSGVPSNVAAAASHALVWRHWVYKNETYHGTLRSLSLIPTFPSGDIDKFFAALRAVTGIETGYAQMFFVPKRWSLGYYADLPTVYGVTCRRYPAGFDDYAWQRDDLPCISREQMTAVSRRFAQLVGRTENRINIAVKRLNACLTRDDAEDAIIDATVGLEVLLGDEVGEAISYKLRMRAAALAGVADFEGASPLEVIRLMRDVYSARSAIVHGKSSSRKAKKQVLSATEGAHNERALATRLLRMVLSALLEHPQYLDPDKIDRELLVGTS